MFELIGGSAYLILQLALICAVVVEVLRRRLHRRRSFGRWLLVGSATFVLDVALALVSGTVERPALYAVGALLQALLVVLFAAAGSFYWAALRGPGSAWPGGWRGPLAVLCTGALATAFNRGVLEAFHAYQATGMPWQLAVRTVLLVPVVEELTYRSGMQGLLAFYGRGCRHGDALAIAATSFLFALGHLGAGDPAWVPFVRIFPISLALGVLVLRFDVRAAIAAHATFNLLSWCLALVSASAARS